MTQRSQRIFFVYVNPELCKGCERCVNSCPKKVLIMDTRINKMGFPTAHYKGSGCIGCGACFYNCPEAEAITVYEENDEAQ